MIIHPSNAESHATRASQRTSSALIVAHWPRPNFEHATTETLDLRRASRSRHHCCCLVEWLPCGMLIVCFANTPSQRHATHVRSARSDVAASGRARRALPVAILPYASHPSTRRNLEAGSRGVDHLLPASSVRFAHTRKPRLHLLYHSRSTLPTWEALRYHRRCKIRQKSRAMTSSDRHSASPTP